MHIYLTKLEGPRADKSWGTTSGPPFVSGKNDDAINQHLLSMDISGVFNFIPFMQVKTFIHCIHALPPQAA